MLHPGKTDSYLNLFLFGILCASPDRFLSIVNSIQTWYSTAVNESNNSISFFGFGFNTMSKSYKSLFSSMFGSLLLAASENSRMREVVSNKTIDHSVFLQNLILFIIEMDSHFCQLV